MTNSTDPLLRCLGCGMRFQPTPETLHIVSKGFYLSVAGVTIAGTWWTGGKFNTNIAAMRHLRRVAPRLEREVVKA